MKRRRNGLLKVINSIKFRKFNDYEIEEEDETLRFNSKEEEIAYYKRIREQEEIERRRREYMEKLTRERQQNDPKFREKIVKYTIELAHELGKVSGEYDSDCDYFTPHKYEYQFDNLKIIHDYYYSDPTSKYPNRYDKNEYLFVYIDGNEVFRSRGTHFIEYFSPTNWTMFIEKLHEKLPALKEEKKKIEEDRKNKDKSYFYFYEAFDIYEVLAKENGEYFSRLSNLLYQNGIIVEKKTFTYDKLNYGEKKFVGYKVDYNNKRVLTIPSKEDRYRIDKDTLLDWYKPSTWQNTFISICKQVYEEYLNRNSNSINNEVNKSLAKINKMYK